MFVQEVVRNFVDEVKSGLRQRMTTRDWLDDTTRHLSIEKVVLEIMNIILFFSIMHCFFLVCLLNQVECYLCNDCISQSDNQ